MTEPTEGEGTDEGTIHPLTLDNLMEGGTPLIPRRGQAVSQGKPGDDTGGTDDASKATSTPGDEGKDQPKAVPIKIGEETFQVDPRVLGEISTLRKFQGAYNSDVAKLQNAVDSLKLEVEKDNKSKSEDPPVPTTALVTQKEVDKYWEGVTALDAEISGTNEALTGKFTAAMRTMANLLGRQMQRDFDTQFHGVLEHLAEHEASMEPTVNQSRDYRDAQDIKDQIGRDTELNPTEVFTALRSLQSAEIDKGGDEDQIMNGYGRMYLIGQAITAVANGTANGNVTSNGTPPDKNSAGVDLDPVLAQFIEAAGGDPTIFKALMGKSKLPPGSIDSRKLALSGASTKAAKDKLPPVSVLGIHGGDANAKVAKLLGFK